MNDHRGHWTPGHRPFASDWRLALHDVGQVVFVVDSETGIEMAIDGAVSFDPLPNGRPLRAIVPPVLPAQLGDPGFRREHSLKFNYVAGAMANGIASVELVTAMAGAGMLGFFGSAGLSPGRVAESVDRLQRTLRATPFGCNLIHSPNEPLLEAEIARLYLNKGVRLVEASAYLDLTLPLIRYRLAGIRRGNDGRVETPNRVVAKASRIEVASKFFAPAPERFVRELVATGELTVEQAELAKRIPVAQDVTAEADSGGHTDNRPLIGLLPTLIALRDRFQGQFNYAEPLRVGAAGGISTPESTAAAFAMGAAYVLVGSIHQACVESGSSDAVRKMLAEAGPTDIAMAPAADMFEMGVRVQVLKRGTMFAMRAAKLFELYRSCTGMDAIPAADRTKLERDLFRAPLEEIWNQTRDFWAGRDPSQVERANADPKHRMALTFRWYLGLSSRWANAGEPTRQADYQVWCGPAMGEFNEWTKGSFLERPENRVVATVAKNLLHGAAVVTRMSFLRSQGVAVPPEVARVKPREDIALEARE